MATKTKKAANAAAVADQGNKDWGAPVAPASLPEGYTVARNITLQTIVLKATGNTLLCRINTPMEKSKVVTKTADGKPQDPATICDVTRLDTGEVGRFLVPKVVEKNLQDGYPDAGYVGKCFYIQCLGKRTEGQRYKDFSISEVNPPKS